MQNTNKHAPDRSRAIYGGSVETSGPYLRYYTTGKIIFDDKESIAE